MLARFVFSDAFQFEFFRKPHRKETLQLEVQLLGLISAAEYIFSDLIRLKVVQKRHLALECRPNPAFPGEPKRPAYCRFSDLSPFPVWAGPGPAEAKKVRCHRVFLRFHSATRYPVVTKRKDSKSGESNLVPVRFRPWAPSSKDTPGHGWDFFIYSAIPQI